MKNWIHILALLVLVASCTKEVEIDIPGYEEQLVVDGRIETNMPPIILLTKSQQVYAPTDLDAFLNSFISGATITLSDGTNSTTLTEICSDNLPPGTEELAASMLGIPADQLANYSICSYTTLYPVFLGQVCKVYTLTVSY